MCSAPRKSPLQHFVIAAVPETQPGPVRGYIHERSLVEHVRLVDGAVQVSVAIVFGFGIQQGLAESEPGSVPILQLVFGQSEFRDLVGGEVSEAGWAVHTGGPGDINAK